MASDSFSFIFNLYLITWSTCSRRHCISTDNHLVLFLKHINPGAWMFCVVTFFFLSTLDSVVFFTGEITVIYSSSIKVQFQKALKYKHSNICRYCICWCVTFQWKAFFFFWPFFYILWMLTLDSMAKLQWILVMKLSSLIHSAADWDVNLTALPMWRKVLDSVYFLLVSSELKY